MSRVMRKSDFCICENKDADQLRGNREADQHLCVHYTERTITLLPKSEISSLWTPVVIQPGLCQTWLETPKTGFLTTRLIYLYLWIDGLSRVPQGFPIVPHPPSSSPSGSTSTSWHCFNIDL